VQKKLFRLFVKFWNNGKLSNDVYATAGPQSSLSTSKLNIPGLLFYVKIPKIIIGMSNLAASHSVRMTSHQWVFFFNFVF
jgi:hypothetical protein